MKMSKNSLTNGAVFIKIIVYNQSSIIKCFFCCLLYFRSKNIAQFKLYKTVSMNVV